ncbi:hypothetical protein [Acrocarpospora catenulata]|uniref:hypothetical protein n=1 Tax=Acrocarpospora catenulata TaxID=2836182 RepID=UPI001BD94213|nr:hypothetical protein [Acrocarpospora catenulata]
MVDPTTALHKALTKTAQTSSSAGHFDFVCGGSTGSGRYSAQSKPSVKMDARISDLNVNGEAKPNKPHLILDNNVIYANTDGLVKTDPKTPWFKIGVDQLPGPNGRMIASLVHGKINDPATIKGVVDAYQDVKKVGEESVNGIKTTHYTGTYDAAKARAALGGTTGGMTSPSPMTSPHHRSPGGETTSPGAGRTPSNLLFDIWVDNKDSLVRKSQYRSEPDAKTKLDITSTVTNYNQPVTVSAPPPNQTKQLDPHLLEKWSGS